MLESKYHRIVMNNIMLYVVCIFLMFLSAVITRNGLLLFLTFIVTSMLIILRFKTLESILPYCIALLMNNTLTEFEIGFLGTVTLTGIIKVYFIAMLFITLVKRKTHNKMYIGYLFVGVWLLYFALNSFINQTGMWSTIYSISFPMIVCIVMQAVAQRNDKYKLQIISGVIAGFIFLCLCGYLELLIGKTFFYSGWTGAERYRLGILRVGSTVSDPNFLALTELFVICIINVPFIRRVLGNRLSLLLIILGSASIVLTFSRTGIIALVTAAVLMGANKHKNYIVVLLPLLSIAAVPVIGLILGSVDTLDVNSAISRNRIVDVAMQLWKNNPLFGNGNNSFVNISQTYIGNQRSTMNEYVGQLVNYGVIGLGFFISYFVLLMKRCVGGFEKLISNKSAICYFSAIITWLLMSYSLDTYYKILIWILPSLVISIESLERGEKNA